jgi:hypothetical protein
MTIDPTTGCEMEACDRCGKTAELFHNESAGLALCEGCDSLQDDLDQHQAKTVPTLVYVIEWEGEIKLITSDAVAAQNEFTLWSDHGFQTRQAGAVLKAEIWENHTPRS